MYSHAPPVEFPVRRAANTTVVGVKNLRGSVGGSVGASVGGSVGGSAGVLEGREFWVWGVWCGVLVLGFGAWGLGFGFEVWDLGFRDVGITKAESSRG